MQHASNIIIMDSFIDLETKIIKINNTLYAALFYVLKDASQK